MNWELFVHILGYAFMEIMGLYLLYDLFSYEFEFRLKKNKYYVLLCAPIVIVNTLIAIFMGSEWRTIFSPLLLLILICFYFIGSSGNKVILAIIYFIVRSVAEGVSALPFTIFARKHLEVNLLSWVLIIIFAQTLFFILMKLVKVFWGRKKNRVMDWRLAFIALLPISTMLIIWDIEVRSMKGEFDSNPTLQVAVILLLIANFAVAAVVERMTLLMQEHREYELLQLHDEMEKRYYETIDEMNHRQTIYRHDMKHCLETLNVLASENKVDQIQKVLSEMQEGIEALTPKVYTNSSIFNAILTEKESRAKKGGILLKLEVEPSIDLSFIKETDMICMFGNLLDNAIRGAEQFVAGEKSKRGGSLKPKAVRGSKQKEVEISEDDGICRTVSVRLFETDGNFILFDVQNHFSGRLNVEKGEFVTTKIIKEGHGLGLKSVKSMTEKYGGVLNITIEDDVFTTTITLAREKA